MAVNKQGFERSYGGKKKAMLGGKKAMLGGDKKKSSYVPMETGKSKSRDYKKRAEAKNREKSKRSGSEQLDRLDNCGYNAKRERAKLKEELRNQ